MPDGCYFKGIHPPLGWSWIQTQGGWWFVTDPTPDSGGVSLRFESAKRHEPALWIQDGTLYAQRDRPGRYPFVWLKTSEGVFVSSDVEFLHRIVPIVGWNAGRVAQTLSLYDDPGSDDCWPGVFRLKPGERASFTEQGLEQQWDYPRDIFIHSEEDAINAIEAALKGVCATIPFHPTLLLSGGLDSTTLAGLLASMGRFPNAGTMISRFESQNEEHVVKSLCDRFNISYQPFSIDDFRPFTTKPWTKFASYGLGLYPDMAYQIPFLEHLKGHGATHFVSGFGADQFFSLSPFRVFEEGLQHRDLQTCQTVLDQVTRRTVVGAALSRLRFWRRLRTKPSWNQLEFWLFDSIHTTPIPTLEGWWYERSMRSIRLQEKQLNSTIFTPYCSSELVDVVEGIEPFIRMAYSNKYLLRLIAQRYLPKKMAWAPKGGFFSEFWEEQLRNISAAALAKRLNPLSPYLKFEPLLPDLIEHQLSNMASKDSTCYAVTTAICMADVLDSFRDFNETTDA